MRVAYVDSSTILGVLFEEVDHERLGSQVEAVSHLYSANLLEAEVRSALNREGVHDSAALRLLERINWVFPERSLGQEFSDVLSAGYLKGADLWHLACALYLRGARSDLEFLSQDGRQLKVAGVLGLRTMD